MYLVLKLDATEAIEGIESWSPPEMWPKRESWLDSLPDEVHDPMLFKTVSVKLLEMYSPVFDHSEKL